MGAKRRASRRHFAGIPFRVLESANYRSMSAYAVALLWDLRAQLKRPDDNGNLDATWSRLSKMPRWASKRTLSHALGELAHFGLIERTRKGKRIGGKHYPSLYAVTWEPIGDLPNKGIAGTRLASNKWKESRPRFRPKKRPSQKTPSSRRILGTPSPSSGGILESQKRDKAADELMHLSQVAKGLPQVAHGYSLYKLPRATALKKALAERVRGMKGHTLNGCGPVGADFVCRPFSMENMAVRA